MIWFLIPPILNNFCYLDLCIAFVIRKMTAIISLIIPRINSSADNTVLLLILNVTPNRTNISPTMSTYQKLILFIIAFIFCDYSFFAHSIAAEARYTREQGLKEQAKSQSQSDSHSCFAAK